MCIVKHMLMCYRFLLIIDKLDLIIIEYFEGRRLDFICKNGITYYKIPE